MNAPVVLAGKASNAISNARTPPMDRVARNDVNARTEEAATTCPGLARAPPVGKEHYVMSHALQELMVPSVNLLVSAKMGDLVTQSTASAIAPRVGRA